MKYFLAFASVGYFIIAVLMNAKGDDILYAIFWMLAAVVLAVISLHFKD